MNRAAQHITRLYPNRGDQVQLARELDISQGYLSRLMRDEQTPGVGVRRIFFERLGIGMELWDQKVPESGEHEAVAPSLATGTDDSENR